MRQHVNPLSSYFQLPKDLPSLNELFLDPALPIHLDIGSARGKFLLSMASLQPNFNYLGLDIRQPLVIAADHEREQLGLTNLKFIFCNANVSLGNWLSNLPSNCLEIVSIQFPDPWFKKRHKKRRVLQPELLLGLASKLKPNSKLFIQSDIKDMIKSMVKLIEITACFDRNENCKEILFEENPFPIPTERECYVLAKGLPIYRVLYTRNNKPIPDLSEFEVAFQTLQS